MVLVQTDEQLEILETITDFHKEARYPNEKFSFKKKCTRIEPMPFRPEDFDNGETLAEEIKRTGMRLTFP